MSTGGRGVVTRKTRVDEVRSIDILDLQRKKVFSSNPGLLWSTSWSRNGEVIASVSFQVEAEGDSPTRMRFMYTITDNSSGAKKNFNYALRLVSTPCHYGGQRWWFLCPLVVNGQYCNRTCRILYMPPGSGYFGCRECYGLTYESRQRHREKFYEQFAKPYLVVEAAQQKLARTRSWQKKEKIWRRLATAEASIKQYADKVTNRKPE